MSKLPPVSGLAAKAIRLLSGDQAGVRITCSRDVSRSTLPPSRRTTYRLEEMRPASWRTKTTRRPSGDQSGSESCAAVAVICSSPT